MTSDGIAASSILVDVQPHRYLHLKRVIDVVLCATALLVLLPFLVALALAIKLHSPGPVLFRQTRVGKDGKTFTFLKFRSMRVNADTSIHRAHMEQLIKNGSSMPANGKSAKLEGDPRITGLGRILRKTSLDELPQLINVLQGEMSLVGPRPPIPYEVELYQAWHKRRFEVLPGITGWWQVKGRNRVSFDDAMRMDVFYVDHLSFWVDLKIVILTPLAMLTGN
jgi:lipopolysaccharide/colanic/teichoic acid biosynthesis glycosyltransferase